MTIAEKMLELLDEGWGRTTLRSRWPGGEIKFRCAVGIRLDADAMTCTVPEGLAGEALKGDPVIVAMARIIREQYPETDQADVSVEDVNLVMLFNDRYARLPDIRAVIEKTIAEGL